ncbi:DUF1493 family protein [Serratia sp. AKBS12]|uniref:DUF1493 family protein n=1 Tax=Serratia sp. AKBS12 TaxID=2974597 RepID=UPI0021657CE2|nr:DUF1493 family protein [Serratia sp. AKBS12]MCS3408300.1 DUF1493 family protein [Serratia sp. AKBS12]HEI8864639.1 DUF1493 family protein [Serratia odorifera]HEI8869145.1 DUF1493 family protein [Serratia odorifera]
MVDETMTQLGVDDAVAVAVAAIISGRNSIPVPGKPRGATAGTSRASLCFRRNLPQRLPFPLPTLTGDINDMMGEYFEKFHIEPGKYELITYYPKQQPLRPLLRLFGVAKAEPPPKLTAGMLIESAKTGRWLY